MIVKIPVRQDDSDDTANESDSDHDSVVQVQMDEQSGMDVEMTEPSRLLYVSCSPVNNR